MPMKLFLFGVGVALVGVVLTWLSGPGVPVIVLGAILAVVGGVMLLGKRRRGSHRG